VRTSAAIVTEPVAGTPAPTSPLLLGQRDREVEGVGQRAGHVHPVLVEPASLALLRKIGCPLRDRQSVHRDKRYVS